MQAWVNREALATAVAEMRAICWPRSRANLRRKDEGFGNVQRLLEIRLEGKPICYWVEQIGGIACNTDSAYCFFQQLEHDAWGTTDKVLFEPEQLNKTRKKTRIRKATPRILEHTVRVHSDLEHTKQRLS